MISISYCDVIEWHVSMNVHHHVGINVYHVSKLCSQFRQIVEDIGTVVQMFTLPTPAMVWVLV